MRASSFSVIAAKWGVALTGIALVGFVVLHLLGNLTIFLGASVINSYAVHLHDLGPLLWVMRVVLLLMVGVHIGLTVWLWKKSGGLRSPYKKRVPLERSPYARYMRLSGLVIVAFLFFHLAQFTWKLFHPEYALWQDALGQPDVFRMVVMAFQNFWVFVFYLLSVGLLAVHLSHGLGSLFQTLGIVPYGAPHFWQLGGKVVALFLFCGYASIPLASFFHFLSPCR